MIYLAGVTSVSIDIMIVDDSGLAVTGLVAATFPTLTYSLAGANADVAFPALSDLATITTAYASGGVKERGNGYYRLDVPNGAFTTGGVTCIRGEASGKHVLCERLHVVAYNPQDAVRLGMTSLPAAAPNANGGLPILSVSGTQLGYGVTLADGVAHGGTLGSSTATLALSRLNVTSQTANQPAVSLTGNGSGAGMYCLGGASGSGIRAVAGAGGLAGIETSCEAGFGGLWSYGSGAGVPGITVFGGDAAAGLNIQGAPGIDVSVSAVDFAGVRIIGDGTGPALQLGNGISGAEGLKVLAGTGNTDADAVVGIGAGTGVGFRSTPDAVGFGGGAGTVDANVISVNGTTFVGDNVPAAPADGTITEDTITVPAEAAGRPATMLGMMRRLFEWHANKRSRSRSTGTVLLRNEADDGTLETQTQTTVSTTDTQTKGA